MSVAAYVIRPASDTSTVEFGSPRFVWLKALKFSHRNSRVFPSVMTKVLDSERLNRYCGGPRSEPLEAVRSEERRVGKECRWRWRGSWSYTKGKREQVRGFNRQIEAI